ADPTAANSGQFTYSNNASVDSTFALQAPGLGSGAYTGIALTQLRTPDAATGQINCGSSYNGLSSISMQGGGTPNTPDYTTGIVDAPCTSFKAAGNSGYGNTSTTCTTPDIKGAIVVNDWQTGGHSVACVLYDSQAHSFTGGAVL